MDEGRLSQEMGRLIDAAKAVAAAEAHSPVRAEHLGRWAAPALAEISRG